MIDSEALGVTRQVTAVLDGLGVAYVIGGSFAGMVHGMVRATRYYRRNSIANL